MWISRKSVSETVVTKVLIFSLPNFKCCFFPIFYVIGLILLKKMGKGMSEVKFLMFKQKPKQNSRNKKLH